MTSVPASAVRTHNVERLFPGRETRGFELCYSATSSAPSLDPRERAAVIGASAVRQLEFAMGRSCARAALEAFGIRPAVVQRDGDRAPSWPAGKTGSISHTSGYAVAVAGRSTTWSLGVDAEQIGSVDAEVAQVALTASERSSARSFDRTPDHPGLTLIFATKEALFKAQFPLTRTWLEFDDVEVIHVDADGPREGSVVVEPVGRSARRLAVAWPICARWTVVDRIVVVGTAAEPARARAHQWS